MSAAFRTSCLALVLLAFAPPLAAQPSVDRVDPTDPTLALTGERLDLVLVGRGLDVVERVEVVDLRREAAVAGVTVEILRRSEGALVIALRGEAQASMPDAVGLALSYADANSRGAPARLLVPGLEITVETGPPVPVITEVEPTADGYVLHGRNFLRGMSEVRLDRRPVASSSYQVMGESAIEVQIPCMSGGLRAHQVDDGEEVLFQHPDPVAPFSIGDLSSVFVPDVEFRFSIHPLPSDGCRNRLRARFVEPDVDLGAVSLTGSQALVVVPDGVEPGIYTLEVFVGNVTARHGSAIVPGEVSVAGLGATDETLGPGGGPPYLATPGASIRVIHQGTTFDRVRIEANGRDRYTDVTPDGSGSVTVGLPSYLSPGGPYEVRADLFAGDLLVATQAFPQALDVIGIPEVEACGTPGMAPVPGDLYAWVFAGGLMVLEGQSLMAPPGSGLASTVTIDGVEAEVRSTSTPSRLEVTVPEGLNISGIKLPTVSNGLTTSLPYAQQNDPCTVQVAYAQFTSMEPTSVWRSEQTDHIDVVAEGNHLGALARSATLGGEPATLVTPLDQDRVMLRFPPSVESAPVIIETAVDQAPLESQQWFYVYNVNNPTVDGFVSAQVGPDEEIVVLGSDLLPKYPAVTVLLVNAGTDDETPFLDTSTDTELHFERGPLESGEVRLRYERQGGNEVTTKPIGAITFVGPPELTNDFSLSAAGVTPTSGSPGNEIRGHFLNVPMDQIEVVVGGQPAAVLGVDTWPGMGSIPGFDKIVIEVPAEESLEFSASWEVDLTVTTPYGSATRAGVGYKRPPLIDDVQLLSPEGALRRGMPARVCGAFFGTMWELGLEIGGMEVAGGQLGAGCIQFTVPAEAQPGVLAVTNRYGTTEVGTYEVIDPER